MSVQILLFTGKGGVGKTTLAAATARRTAALGRKTLVLSADPAHSLADALDSGPLGAEPSELAPGLCAMQLDGLARMQRGWTGGGPWQVLLDGLRSALSDGGLDPILAEELTVLPGLDELLTLQVLAEQVARGMFDTVVVDCAPNGQTLRLLALPEALDRYLERIYPTHQRMLRTLGLLGRARPSEPNRAGQALALTRAVESLHETLRGLRSLLTDPSITRIRMVLTPDALALAETRRAATALALFGYTVDGVVVNQVLPMSLDPAPDTAVPDPGVDWLTGWTHRQQRVLAELADSFADLPRYRVSHTGVGPVGPAALDEVAQEVYGPIGSAVDPFPTEAPGPSFVVEPDGADYVLRLRLRQRDPAGLELERVGDELAVTVGGHRRLYALPGLLVRCKVIGATSAQGCLLVRFAPDPDRWPRDLFAAAEDRT